MHALDQRHHHAWGDGMRTLVEQARGQAGPRDAAIVVGTMGVKGWSYYMWSYQGRSNTWARGPIPPDRTLVGDPPQRSSVTAFLAAHRDAGRGSLRRGGTGVAVEPGLGLVDPHAVRAGPATGGQPEAVHRASANPTLLDLEVREGRREEARMMGPGVRDVSVGVLGRSADQALGRDG